MGAEKRLSYSLATPSGGWEDYPVGSEPYVGFVPPDAYLRDAVRWAIGQWANVLDLQFIELDEGSQEVGQIRVGYTGLGMDRAQLGYSYMPGDGEKNGDIWLNGQLKDSLFGNFIPGSLGSFILLHELGHALGLKHPNEASYLNPNTVPPAEDSLFSSAMSYFVRPDVLLTQTSLDRFPTTPMALDIDALRIIYGENLGRTMGDDIYVYASNAKYLETLYDAGGIDEIVVVGACAATIDLRPGEWSNLGIPAILEEGSIEISNTVCLYKTSLIENATGGTGHDLITGNDLDNRLCGGPGNDTLDGGWGMDTLQGGEGADVLTGSDGADLFYFDALTPAGFDRIRDFSTDDLLAFDTGMLPLLADVHAGNFARRKSHDTDDYLIFKPGSKSLFFDADGSEHHFAPIKLVALKGPAAKFLAFDDLIFL